MANISRSPDEEATRRECQRELMRERACRHRANRNVRARETEAKRQQREDLKNIEVRYSLMNDGHKLRCFDSVREVELAGFFFCS